MWTYRHSSFAVHQLAALSDNYIYLIAPNNSQALAAVDPAETEPVITACKTIGRPLTHIFNTHHHWDHTGANAALKSEFGCSIIGNANDAARIPGIDVALKPGQARAWAGLDVQVIDVPGHTLGHIAYVIEDALFCGDTLFGAGCGRLFEGTPEQMCNSLSRLAALPSATRVYCAHEYTLANLRFAAAVDANNPDLMRRLQTDADKRELGKPTIPSTIGSERATNPFLRAADPSFCTAYAEQAGIAANALDVFTDIRSRK
ncbi:MAG: hydroxyacylglutathione hydrolase, partial [Mariprofundaceae bacterium]